VKVQIASDSQKTRALRAPTWLVEAGVLAR
jgi:hypothetical protein